MSKIQATQQILSFMGELALRYSASDMNKLWNAMDLMRKRYGDLFVAENIERNKTEAELALFRYWKTNLEKQAIEETKAEHKPRFVHVYPRQRNIAKHWLSVLAIITIYMVVATLAASI